MPALAFATYFLYGYVALPLALTGVRLLYSKRYDICPLVRCIGPLSTCVREPECRAWLDDVSACRNPNSEARQRSARSFAHVQHPEDPAYCQYQSFDRMRTDTAVGFLECIGNSGCLAPASFTDTCATVPPESVLPLENTIPVEVLQGTWNKLFSTGWDLWPCQWTDFFPPKSSSVHDDLPEADTWMTQWPNAPNVWRMDLYWQNADSPMTFHMDNEMYPGQTWNFSSTTTTPATLRTRAVMWGTEAHENWYLLDYHPEWQTMLVYYCAYTEAVDRFDSMAMVLKKRQGDDSTPPHAASSIAPEQVDYFQRRAQELLGDKHGNLQRVPMCLKRS